MGASFYKKKIMSKAEYKVFRIIESELQTLAQWLSACCRRRVSERSSGLKTKRHSHRSTASAVDILVIGPYGDPVAAIEYQGGGHHQGTSAARDAIKKEALRKAGVQFLEIVESHSTEEIIQQVRQALSTACASGRPKGLCLEPTPRPSERRFVQVHGRGRHRRRPGRFLPNCRRHGPSIPDATARRPRRRAHP